MQQHIEPYENKNNPIVDVGNKTVPLIYFNHIKLNYEESYNYYLENHESVIAVVMGKIDVYVDDISFLNIGKRKDLWSGKPEGIYVGKNSKVSIKCFSKKGSEVYVAGGLIEKKFPPFKINQQQIQKVCLQM